MKDKMLFKGDVWRTRCYLKEHHEGQWCYIREKYEGQDVEKFCLFCNLRENYQLCC